MLRNRVLYKKESGPIDYIEIAGVKWALENEGTSPDFPQGLLYQYGRKYGQGYDGESMAITFVNGPVDVSQDNATNANVYWGGMDWVTPSFGNVAPDVYGEWRLPTASEFAALYQTGYTRASKNNIEGIFFGPNHANPSLRNDTCVFLPFAGRRSYGTAELRGQYGYIYIAPLSSDNEYSRTYYFTSNKLSSGTAVRSAGLSLRLVKK